MEEAEESNSLRLAASRRKKGFATRPVLAGKTGVRARYHRESTNSRIRDRHHEHGHQACSCAGGRHRSVSCPGLCVALYRFDCVLGLYYTLSCYHVSNKKYRGESSIFACDVNDLSFLTVMPYDCSETTSKRIQTSPFYFFTQ